MTTTPPTHREYSNDAIVVTWEPQYCIHTARCLRGAPDVFDTQRRPWIVLEGADADRVAEVVERCPTGALGYRRLDGAPEEQAASPPAVRAVRDGPLFVRGDVALVDPAGELVRRAPRMALCRCGATENPPFCDNSHRRVGFSDGAAPPPA